MAFKFEVAFTTCNTSTGNQTISLSSGFGVPDGAMFFVTRATGLATAADVYFISVGAASSATERWCMAWNQNHATANTDTGVSSDTDSVIRIQEPGGQDAEGLADISSFGTDQIVINWSDNSPGAYRLMVWAFQGDNFHAGNATCSGSIDGTTDVTAPGFEPQFGFGVTIDRLTGDDSTYTHAAIGLGMFHNDGVGGVTQRSWLHYQSNGSSSAGPDGRLNTSYVAGRPTSAGDDQTGVEIGSFDSSGFTITTRLQAFNATTDFFYFCGEGAQDVKIINYAMPGATGSDSITSIGFRPLGVAGIMTFVTALDTARSGHPEMGSSGLFGADGTTEACVSAQNEDGAADMNTQSFADSKILNLPADDGTAGYTATWTQWTSTGLDLNFSAIHGSGGHYAFMMAFEEEPSGSVAPMAHNYRMRRVNN